MADPDVVFWVLFYFNLRPAGSHLLSDGSGYSETFEEALLFVLTENTSICSSVLLIYITNAIE
jgi:hypothetical protein